MFYSSYSTTMNSTEILKKFQQQRFEVFQAQNPEAIDFDVVFEINGKKLYANKYTLFSISTTFRSMLSERWTQPNEPIKIETYSFENFKELLTFIYSGECNITNENIFQIIDIAEFYDIQILKNVCENFLSETQLNLENIYQRREISNKYSLEKLKKSANEFFTKNFVNFLKSEFSQMLEKSKVKDLVEEFKETIINEHLFEGVYKWAENRASENQKLNINLNLNEKIKEELTEILPLIKFEKMNSIFLIKFVVKKYFLFPGDQLSDLLWNGKKTYVKITDKNGKIMKGEIQCDNDERVATDIQSVKDKPANRMYADYFYWLINGTRPSTPSKLSKNEKIKWYLLYDTNDNIAVRSCERIYYRDYLLAEMFAEDGFTLSTHCKIEVFCSN